MTTFQHPALPGVVQWKNEPVAWTVDADQRLRVETGDKTDWFIDPGGRPATRNAPSALFTPPDANFILSAKVAVDFAYDFDAGVLHIYANDDLWAKLCFEYSPQQQPMVVSVVTKGVSDDCNSVDIHGKEVYLRMAVTPQTVAFHYSLDGAYWHFVRYFSLGKLDNLQVGFITQAPSGPKCSVVFSEISYRAGVLANNRSGE
jgi:hypothetical protein